MSRTITVRLTEDNVETTLKPGDRFADDPEFGTVQHVHRISFGAKVFTNVDSDTLGLPQTVRLIRD